MYTKAIIVLWILVGMYFVSGSCKAWHQNAVVYQIYPRSFQDSDGDGIGDLQGILQHVDYLVELGIDAIWLNPIYTSPNKDFGYDITDMTSIDPIYGTMDDFELLVSVLNEKNIYVIMDFVPNHTSDQHPWFIKSAANDPEYRDYYVWLSPINESVAQTTPSLPNNWVSNFNGSMWEYHPGRKQFYLHQFLKYQPDLNYRNDKVLEAMKDVLKFWLSRGVHGFRMDAVFALVENDTWKDEPYIGGPTYSYSSYDHTMTAEQPLTFKVLREFRKTIDYYGVGSTLMMTESYKDNYADIRRYYGQKYEPISTFPFNFFLITKGNLSTSAQQWATLINDWYKKVIPGQWAVPNFVLGNHDQHRLTSRLNSEYTDIMNMLQLILKGTAVVYFGDEIGLKDSFLRRSQGVDPVGINATDSAFMAASRDPERGPFPWNNTYNGGFTNSTPWLPLSSDYLTINAAAQRNNSISHLSVFKSMTKLRKYYNMGIRSCDVEAVGNALIVFRTLRDRPTLIGVFNMANQMETVNLKIARKTLPTYADILVQSVNYQVINSALNKTSKFVATSKIVLPPLSGLVLTTFQKTDNLPIEE